MLSHSVSTRDSGEGLVKTIGQCNNSNEAALAELATLEMLYNLVVSFDPHSFHPGPYMTMIQSVDRRLERQTLPRLHLNSTTGI